MLTALPGACVKLDRGVWDQTSTASSSSPAQLEERAEGQQPACEEPGVDTHDAGPVWKEDPLQGRLLSESHEARRPCTAQQPPSGGPK